MNAVAIKQNKVQRTDALRRWN